MEDGVRLRPALRCCACRGWMVWHSVLLDVARCRNPDCYEFDRPKLVRG